MTNQNPITWNDFKNLYLERLDAMYESIYPTQVRRTLERFTRELGLETRPLCEITNLDLARYVTMRKKAKWRGQLIGNRTVNNEIENINTCLTYAGPKGRRGRERSYLGLIPDPPWHESLPELQRDPVTFQPAMLKTLFEAIEAAKSPKHKDCSPQQFWEATFLLLFVTTVRRRALLNLPRPDDFELLEKLQLRVPAEFSKTRTEQTIHLGSREVVDVLAALPTKPGEPLLPWKDRAGNAMSPCHFNHTMKNFQREAGIPEAQIITSKNFRSTASTAIADVYSAAVAKRRLGHSPNTNTFEKFYQARVNSLDSQASQHLSSIVLPFVSSDPEPNPTEQIADASPKPSKPAGINELGRPNRGDWTFSPSGLAVYRDGVGVKLAPRVLQLLQAFLAALGPLTSDNLRGIVFFDAPGVSRTTIKTTIWRCRMALRQMLDLPDHYDPLPPLAGGNGWRIVLPK